MAYQMRRRLSIFDTMRQPSANDGGSSSVSTASSATPIARRSWAPRTGSRRRKARITRMAVGMAKTMNGVRHPKLKASMPPSTGPEELPDRVGRPVERVHAGAHARRVVVGQQGVVGGIDHRPPDRRAAADDGQHHDADGQAGQEGEEPPRDGPGDDDRHALVPVGHGGDRHLEAEGGDVDDGDQGQQALGVEVEGVPDLGEEDPERGAVELVHHVQAEEHEQGVDRAVPGERVQPPDRVDQPAGPVHGRAVADGPDAHGRLERARPVLAVVAH